MSLHKNLMLSTLVAASMLPALGYTQAAIPIQSSGALIVVPASGEVRRANDQAMVTFTLEEQDKDKAAAASRVNARMKQGSDIVKATDPQAQLKTRGYYTYPVYADEPISPQPRSASKPRQPIGWRVGQSLEVTTVNLAGLPKTVAAAQRILAVNGIQFSLTEASVKKADDQRIAAAYRNLTERIVAVATAMGRNPADAVLDTVDFEASGAYAPAAAPKAMMRAAAMQDAAQVEEPSFEPGETSLSMQVVGKVRFK